MSEDPTTQPGPEKRQPEPEKQPAASRRPDRSRQGLLWVLAILLLLAVIVLAWFAQNQWQQRQGLSQQLDALQQTVERIQGQSQSPDPQVESRLGQIEASQQEQGKRQQSLERKVDQAARSLLQMGNRTRSDWLLAEAEYLMRIANQRLQMERDIGGALALLKSADAVLRETEDMSVYPVREELAQEIQSLKAIHKVDRVGLYLQLEAAIEQVENLATANLANTDPLDAAKPGTRADSATDQPRGSNGSAPADFLAEAWETVKQTLSEVIVIRRMDEPVSVPLSPKQSAYASLNLRLMLEQAEMALLSATPVLYQRALSKAQDFLARWYDTSDPAVAALKRSLQSLAEQDIKPELPDISDSLNLIKARINGRQEAIDSSGSESSSQGGSDAGNSADQPSETES